MRRLFAVGSIIIVIVFMIMSQVEAGSEKKCKSIAKQAEWIMEQRQNGVREVPILDKAIDTFDHGSKMQSWMVRIVKDAYDKRIAPTRLRQNKMIKEFREKCYNKCREEY